MIDKNNPFDMLPYDGKSNTLKLFRKADLVELKLSADTNDIEIYKNGQLQGSIALDVNIPEDGALVGNTVSEYTAGSGVTVDGVLLKDGIVQAINGTVAAPSIRGAATNSGIYFGSGTAGFSTAGSHSALLDGQGDFNITGKYVTSSYTNGSGTPGNATISKATGRFAIAAGAGAATITNTLVSATSVVICQVETTDATLKSVSVVPGAGSFVVTGNANATGNTTISFIVFND